MAQCQHEHTEDGKVVRCGNAATGFGRWAHNGATYWACPEHSSRCHDECWPQELYPTAWEAQE